MLFSENRISLGIALPLQPRIASDIRFNEQIELVKLAEKFGFQAVWVRDVPLNNGRYPDPLGHSDPFVLLSAIAVSTSSIHLVTGAIVLTLRHPLHVAKAALSLQSLSGDRFVLGVGSGDRPSEFKVFDQNYDDRKVLFREKWSVLRNALDDDEIASENGEGERTKFWLRPRTEVKVAMLAVGSASQSLEWIARNSTGWATYHRDLAIQKDRIALWHKAVSKAGGGFRSFSTSMNLDLADDAEAALTGIELGYRCGRNQLVDVLRQLRSMGTHHVMLNLGAGPRPVMEVIEEIGSFVIDKLNE